MIAAASTGSGALTESHDVGYVGDSGFYVNGNRTSDRYLLAPGATRSTNRRS